MVTYQGEQYDFGKPFDRMTEVESILQFNPDLKAAILKPVKQQLKSLKDCEFLLKKATV